MASKSTLLQMHTLESQASLIRHLQQISIFGAIVCGIMTTARLYLRRSRLWWDDSIASLSMLFMIFSTVTVNLHLQYDSWLEKPIGLRVALFYLFNIGFYLTMWSFRISVLLALIRLRVYQKVLVPIIGLFSIACIILCVQTVWTCEKQTAWHSMMMPSCSLGKGPAIINIIFSVLADATLLACPTYALWRTRTIPFVHRVRLAVVFGTIILVTIICMVHSAYTLTQPGLNLVLVTVLQLTVALIVCNLPVVSASLHRLYTRYQHSKQVEASNRPISTILTSIRFSIPNKPEPCLSIDWLSTSSEAGPLHELPPIYSPSRIDVEQVIESASRGVSMV